MQTLEQLSSGELKGARQVKLSCGLTEVPRDLFSLADTLEVLDLSVNAISALPEDFGRLRQLKIVFFSDNLFTEFPKVLSECSQLSMIGFKSNQIAFMPEGSLPATTRWLILTNNKLKTLPRSIGNCPLLQKVALAGNYLTSLPKEMANCRNLELLRISANRLTELPEWLLELPRLAWLAFAGNPFSNNRIGQTDDLPEMDWSRFDILEQLGEGASGHIYKALWRDQTTEKDVAIKVYKGEVTSDGFPDDEMTAAISAGKHPCLVDLLGSIFNHPEHKQGLVMSLIPPSFYNLGLPPSLQSCTRDVFPAGTVFTSAEILKIALAVSSLAAHLHQKGMMHGDLYAHNILIDKNTQVLMGDFGAASFYSLTSAYSERIQQIEARAFGCLLDDLLSLLDPDDKDVNIMRALTELRARLMQNEVIKRPLFKEAEALLKII